MRRALSKMGLDLMRDKGLELMLQSTRTNGDWDPVRGRLEHLLQPTKGAAMVLQVEEAMNIA